jgi:TPP-dependent pyruvate/acetoin dehydrogenase alpha subunit
MNVLRDDPKASLFETMSLIRATEEALIAHQQATQGGGTCTSVGQEASAAGVVAALAAHDRILSNHRSVGHLIARGAEPGRIFAEVMGKSTGYCRGKSGTLHISARELGVILTSTIVGGELSMAPGVGLSQSLLAQDDGIVVCFFGDGAACEGIFHESLNLARMWKLPVLYVCENNQWQAYVRRDETMPHARVTPWAAAHGMPAAHVDGMDAEAVHAAAQDAVAYVRRTRSPMFLEVESYRLRGHFEPDDQAYVDAAELARWRARDPIATLRAKLDPSISESVAQRVRARIEAGLAFAAASPAAALEELTTDVYA